MSAKQKYQPPPWQEFLDCNPRDSRRYIYAVWTQGGHRRFKHHGRLVGESGGGEDLD